MGKLPLISYSLACFTLTRYNLKNYSLYSGSTQIFKFNKITKLKLFLNMISLSSYTISFSFIEEQRKNKDSKTN
jgi:hypothetical protein